MFTVYVLYSQKFNKIYIGYTSDLVNRFLSHNELATKGHTIKYRPWVIAHAEEFETKAEAMKREAQLKTANGRDFIWNIIREKFGSSDG
jgi:putative endonuclease